MRRKINVITSLAMAATISLCSFTCRSDACYGMLSERGDVAVSVSEIDAVTENAVVSLSEDEEKIASLHNPIVDASTGSITFSYVYFGSYPQSEVTGEELTEEIINAEYMGDDAVVCGEKYRRLEQNHQYRYFKYEPIKWRVSEIYKGKAILRSESILDCKPYNKDNTLEHGYSTTWVRTTIRCWLNGYQMYENNGFLQSAFSEMEKYGIIDTTIREEAYNSSVDVEESVEDKVFLMNKWSILPNWWKQDTLIAKDTEYATAVYGTGEFCNQWMLAITDASYKGFYTYVDSAGMIHADGLHGVPVEGEENRKLYYMNYNDEVCGICPAIQLDLSNTELWMTEEEYVSSLEKVYIAWTKGDLNKSGTFDLQDAQLVLKYALKIEQYSKVQEICADVDEDDMVTLLDAQTVLRKVLKI